VGSAREREGGGGSDHLPVPLRAGREVFADVAAAMASEEAASQCSSGVLSYTSSHYYGSLFAFPAPPGLGELLEVHGAEFRFSAEAPVHRLVAAGAPGAAYCAELYGMCWVRLGFSGSRSGVSLNLNLYHCRLLAGIEEVDLLDIGLSASTLGGSRIGITVKDFLGQLYGLEDVARGVRSAFGIPGSRALVLSLLDLAAWLARKSKKKWGDAADAAAGLVATLSPVLAAASHEVRRASRVRVSGLDYPAVKEAAEEARRRALEAYSTIVEKAATGQGPVPKEVKRVMIGGRLSVGRVLKAAARPDSAKAAISASLFNAGEHIKYAVWSAAAARAAAEVLASLSEPG